MEFHQLRYLLAVAQASSFVRAAAQEGIGRPSLSQPIKRPESALGVPLFDRLGRSVPLTRYGQVLLPQAEMILRQVQEAYQAVEAVQQPDAGILTVGAIPTVLPYSLLAPLAEFRRACPAVHLRVRGLDTEHLVAALCAAARSTLPSLPSRCATRRSSAATCSVNRFSPRCPPGIPWRS